ncbi:hypothetical protein HMPREF3224_02074 [Anaerococcus hydrogenalis]|nr:hypothetical protein HMPREF3224_02074 [Anaerococcus hydrogenalis]
MVFIYARSGNSIANNVFITFEYKHFWQINGLSNEEDVFLGAFVLRDFFFCWPHGGGILEPYLKYFFEKRILKKQKQRTVTDADQDNC